MHGDGAIRSVARDLIGAIERQQILGRQVLNDLEALLQALDRLVASGSRDVAPWYPGDETCDPYCHPEVVLTAVAERLTPMLDRIRALHHAMEQVLDVLHAERALAEARQYV